MQYKNINIKDIKENRVTWYGTTFLYKFFPSKLVNKLKFYYLKKLIITTKGYKIFNSKSQSDLYYKIIEDFDDLNFEIKNYKFSKTIFGDNINNYEQVIKQVILKFILNQSRSQLNISRSILFAKKNKIKLIYPIHPIFISILEKNNIKVNKYLSLLCWQFVILFFYFLGLKKIIQINLSFFKKNIFDIKNSVYLDTLPKDALNVDKNFFNKENFFTFILNYFNNKNLNLKRISHSIRDAKTLNFDKLKICYSDFYINDFNLLDKISFIMWSLKAIILSFVDIFRGRWWHAFLLFYAAERQLISMINPNNLHKVYFFNQIGGYIFRPLWSYEAEKKGSDVIFYFYSLNYSPLTKKIRRPPAIKSSSWSQYIVWNKIHEQYLRDVCKLKFEVSFISPVFMITGMEDFYPPDKNFITVFDIPPLRTVWLKSKLLGTNLYHVDNCILFLKNIIEEASKKNLKVILKIKRLNSVVHSKYLVFLRNEAAKGTISIVNENISTISLIKKSNLIISYPITTINKIADIYKIKNYYYLPINEKLNNELLSGSKILYEKKELVDIFKHAF